ncbi:MAG: hypothetical protein MUE72_13740 [Chitinophagaceae bacterium]|jgi:hypothetical protein|nr:hypothetical protein [Chitinophagaceae bacterium]
MRNVTTNNAAVENGLIHEFYPFATFLLEEEKDIQILARLDFKTWAKFPGIHCYFTEIETQRGFKINLFQRKKDGEYKLDNKDSIVDFTTCPTGRTYRLNISLKNDMPKLMYIEIVE